MFVNCIIVNNLSNMGPEEVCSQSTSQRLPDTCPISQTDLSQVTWISQNTQQPWGHLYPTRPEFQSLELIKDEYTVGRGPDCDISVKLDVGMKESSRNRSRDGSCILGAISKVHFRIRRTNISSPQYDDFIAHLDDLSSNGTFVNGRKIGRGSSVILENYNEIAICFPHYKAFIYISTNLDSEVKAYPEEVKVQYAISRILGSGSFGQVRLVFDKPSGKALAMKIIQKKRLYNDAKRQLYDPVRTQREVDVLKALSSVFIIKFENVIDSDNYMFILTEYMEGGELFDRVKNGPLLESYAKLYFFQLAMAVKYLHDHGIIHRDIKLENILLSSREPESLIKLSDFGFSKFLDQEHVMMTYCGTPLYIAPEILINKGRSGSYDKKIDIWSMGVVLYICLCGVPPFESNGPQLTEQILNGRYSFSSRHWCRVSRKAVHLVRKMMTVNPLRRLSTEELLRHEWLKDKSLTMRVNRLLHKLPAEAGIVQTLSDEEVESDIENERVVKKARVGN